MIDRPTANEHPQYFGGYIALVEESDALKLLDANREIEFDCSHPNRGGRIWPVEAKISIRGKVGR